MSDMGGCIPIVKAPYKRILRVLSGAVVVKYNQGDNINEAKLEEFY